MVAVLHRNLDQGVLMPAERRPDPIQPEPSHLVDAALLLALSLTTPNRQFALRMRDIAEAKYGAAFLIPILERLVDTLSALPNPPEMN